MSNPCMEFFESNAENKQKVKALIENGCGNQWICDKESASPHSPGIVEQGENVVRQVHSPVHWDAVANEVKPGFYDDLTSKGLSVNRVSYAPAADLSDASESRATLTGREAIGFVHAPISSITTLLSNENGPLGAVFDTALHNDVSHADVCATVARSNEERRKLRFRLYEGLKSHFRRGRLE